MGTTFTFSKAERLCNHHLIGDLFAKKGKSIVKHPILIAFIETELNADVPAQVIISVSKRKFKKASDRNVLRRRIREAYRLNKHVLYKHLQLKNKQVALAIMYLDKKPASYQAIEAQLLKAFEHYGKRN